MSQVDVPIDGGKRADAAVEIRSYRTVFDLERRIYRVDRVRLNPAGVPVRGIVYYLVLLLATLLLARVPLFGALARAAPWYLRDLAAPGAAATLLTIVKVEGRPFHLAALALARYSTSARELAGIRPYLNTDRRWRLQELLVVPDGSDQRLRRLRYTGPGAVLVHAAHVRSEWDNGLFRALTRSADITLDPLSCGHRPAGGQVIALAARARLQVNVGREPNESAKASRPSPGLL